MAPRRRTDASPTTAATATTARIVVPVRYAAWLSGDLGRSLERTLQRALAPLGPVKVTRFALQNAASVASMILTTECLITDVKEEPKSDGHDHSQGMNDMGM